MIDLDETYLDDMLTQAARNDATVKACLSLQCLTLEQKLKLAVVQLHREKVHFLDRALQLQRWVKIRNQP